MPVVQIVISEKANTYLRKKAPAGRGMGMYVSELVVAEATREEAREALQAHRGAVVDAWETESGLETME